MSESQTPRCEHCGSDRIHYGPPDCPMCGAPNCCLVCCKISRLESELTATRARLAELEGIAERLKRAVDVSLKAMETAYERSFTGMLRGFMGGKIDEVKAILAYKEGKR